MRKFRNGERVALYGGEGGRGVVVRSAGYGSWHTYLVKFEDGQKVWCSEKNLGLEQ